MLLLYRQLVSRTVNVVVEPFVELNVVDILYVIVITNIISVGLHPQDFSIHATKHIRWP